MPEPSYPLAPTVPRVLNTYGDVRYQPHRPDPLQPWLPTPDEIQQSVGVQEQERSRGLFWDLLALPEKIFGGQAIKGAVRGGAEGGFLGALEGFARGTPFAFASDWLFGTNVSRETSAADIRRVFGDKSEQNQFADLFINLGIDLALDPVTLFLNPFGKTAQGLAKAAKGAEAIVKAQVAAAGETGQLLARSAVHAIEDSFAISASLKKAVDVGDKAAFVLKLPFAQAPFFESNLGFKSISLAFAGALDATMGAVRTGPLGDLIRHVNVRYPDVADPEKAAAVRTAFKREDVARNELRAQHLAIMLNKVGPEIMDIVARKPEYHEAFLTLGEIGHTSLTKADDAAQLTFIADHPDVMIRRENLNRLLKTDPEFRSLYEKATSADAAAVAVALDAPNGLVIGDNSQAALKALNDIYRKYPDIPLPDELMEAAKLPKRYGVELSAFDEPLTPTLIADAHPQSLSAGEITRDAAARQLPNQEKDVLLKTRERLKKSFDDIMALPEADRAQFQKYLEGRAYAMKELARAEAIGGLMNASFEFYAGPYVYRMLAPEAKALLNNHVRTRISEMGGHGVNVNERFLKNREFTDLLTIEASAIAEELGIKATGYQPLKGLAEAFNKHGADGVWGSILDKPFIRKLWEMDPEAAAFFSTNPLHNDYSRALAGGRAMGKVAYFDSLFDSVMKKTTTRFRDVEKNGSYTQQGMVGVIRTKDAPRKISEPDAATIIRKGVEQERNEQFKVAYNGISEDLSQRLSVEQADFNAIRTDLEKALDISPRLDDPALVVDNVLDSEATRRMKNAAREVKAREQGLANYKRKLDAATTKNDKLRFGEVVADEKARLATARSDLDDAREAAKEALDDMRASTREVQAMMKGKARDQRGLLRAMQGAGSSASQFNRELKLTHLLKREGGLALDEAEKLGLTKNLNPETEIHWFEKNDWEAAKAQLAELNAPDFLRQNPIARVLDTVKAVWAPYTAVNPLFLNSRVRDQVTNMLSLVNGGFRHWSSIWEAKETRRALSRTLAGKPEEASLDAVFAQRRMADGALETMTRREALDFMQSRGTVSGTSMWAGDVMDTAEDYAARHKIPTGGEIVASAFSAILPIRKGVNSPIIRKGAELAAYLDDTARIAGFRDAWMRGMTKEQASQHVGETLYNSLRQSTSTERYILRRIIPFYSFSRWAIENSVNLYLQKPGVLASLGKIRDNSYNTPLLGGPPMDPAQVDTILPQFLKDGLGIPYKNTPEGPRFFMFGGYLPVGEISQLVAGLQGLVDPDSTNGMLNYIGSKLHPAVKVPLSFLLNRDFFSDRDVEKFPGEHREFLGMPMTGKAYQIAHQVRFLSELDRLKLFTHEQAKVITQAAGGTKPLGQREELPLAEAAIGSAFGVAPKTYLVDVSNDTRFARQRNADKINETKGLLRRRLIESEGKPAAKADVASLKEVLADQLAEKALMDQLGETYGVNAREQLRALRRRDQTALRLLRRTE